MLNRFLQLNIIILPLNLQIRTLTHNILTNHLLYHLHNSKVITHIITPHFHLTLTFFHSFQNPLLSRCSYNPYPTMQPARSTFSQPPPNNPNLPPTSYLQPQIYLLLTHYLNHIFQYNNPLLQFFLLHFLIQLNFFMVSTIPTLLTKCSLI